VGSPGYCSSNIRWTLSLVRYSKPDLAEVLQRTRLITWQYNLLSELLQEPTKKHLGLWLARLAFIGFAASVVSDTVSNSLRVVKTFRQVSLEKVSYRVYCYSGKYDTILTELQPRRRC
jgi:hypothetical protein